MNKIEQLIKQFCPDGVEFKKTGDVCEVLRGKRLTKKELSQNEKYPVYHGGIEVLGYYKQYNRKANTTMIINTGSVGEVVYSFVDFWSSDGTFTIKTPEHINDRFLYFVLKIKESYLKTQKREGGVPTISKATIENIKIPIPPLPIQQEIVSILDKFTQLGAELEAELEERKKQYEYYRDQLLQADEEGMMSSGVKAEWKTLDLISENFNFKRKPVRRSNRESGEYPYYGASGIVDYVSDYIFDGDYLLVSEDGANLIARNTPIAFSISGKTWVNNHAHVLKFNDYVTRRFVEIYLNSIDLSKYITGAAQPKLNKENLYTILVPIPSLKEQERIVEILDKFDTLVNDTKIGLPAEIAARQKQYEYYRGKLLDFKNISNG